MSPLPTALLLAFVASTSETDLRGWLEEVDNARAALSEAVITVRASQLVNGEVTESANLQIYTKGKDRGLVVFRGGKNDGRKILNVGEKTWLMVPGASRAIPITANQRLLGGAAVGDVARIELAAGFTAELRPGAEEVGGKACRVLDLTAGSPSAPYAKVILWFDEAQRLPCRMLFTLTSGKPAREVTFVSFRQVSGRTIVAAMEVRDLLTGEPGALTRLEYLEVKPARIDDEFFTPEGALNF